MRLEKEVSPERTSTVFGRPLGPLQSEAIKTQGGTGSSIIRTLGSAKIRVPTAGNAVFLLGDQRMNMGVDNVLTSGLGLGSTGVGSGRIPHDSWGWEFHGDGERRGNFGSRAACRDRIASGSRAP